MFTAKAPYKFMKLKMHLRIKQATLRTLYSYVGILSLLVNTSSPFLVSLQYTAYAQEVGAAVEESAPSEEPSEEAAAAEVTSGEETSATEEVVTDEVPSDEPAATEEVLGTSTEDQAATPTETPIDETQQGDILPDGVSDYRPEGIAESSPEDIAPVEPILVDSAPTTEIITDTTDIIDPLVEQIEGPVFENGKECLADGVEIVNSSNDEWTVDSEKGYSETKEPVKLGVKYIFPVEEGVSVTFSCLPKNEDDRSVLRIQEVKVSDLNLPEEFKTDAEFAYDITTDMVNGEFEYDLTLPKPEGVEAGVAYIEKDLDKVLNEEVNIKEIEVVKDEKVRQAKEESDVKVEGLDHFTVFVPVTFSSSTALPSSVKLEQWETKPSGNWITGSLGSSNSDYKEGEIVPFRLDMGKLSTSSNPYKFSICRDYQDGTKKGYLSLMPYNTSRSATPGGTISYTEIPISGINISDIAVNEVGAQGSCASGERETQLYFYVQSSSLDSYLLWGGELASPLDAGAGNGASQYAGASLHMSLLTPNKDVSINPSAIIELATITVTKIVEGGSMKPEDWGFSLSPNPNNEALPKYPSADSDTVTFIGLTSGSYQITETAISGYSYKSGSGTNCTFSSEGVATANVLEGVNATNATCTFTNEQSSGTLVVIKNVQNDNGGTKGVADFGIIFSGGSLNFDAGTAIGSTTTYTSDSVTLVAGSEYTLQESNVANYEEGTWGCGTPTDGGLKTTFTPTAGQNIVCSITNNDEAAPTIEVTKTANPTSVPETGADVTFTFLVENTGPEDVVLTSLTDDIFGNLDGAGTCDVPQAIAVGGSYSCTYTTRLSSDSLAAHTNVVTAVAEDDDQTTATDTDDETVTFENVAPTIEVTKTANPTSVPETGADVTFTFLVENTGPEDVVLTSLTDDIFGNLDGAGTCDVPQAIAVGGSYSCTYTTRLSSDSLAAHTNVVTAVAEDDDQTTATDTDDETVTFENVAPVVDIEKTVDEEALALPGGEFTFTLNITNNSQETVTITSLTDTNALSQQCLDLIGTSLAAGANISCQYTTTHTQVGTYENMAEITVTDNDESTGTDQDSQTVRVVSLTISKFNNSTQPEEIGDEVLFTIIVKAEGASLTDLLVVDLPSKGFDFLTGSWHASSSILERDVEQDIADNDGIYGYTSPGYWPIGNISDGETITLTYLAEIQPGVDEGDYMDIAWAKAYWGDSEVRDGPDSSLLVFAQAVNQGDLNYSNDIFVGTHVAVTTPNTPPEAEAEVDEEEITEEVLGTSTIRLPATGSDTTVLVSALAVMLLGVSMITLSRKKKVLLVLPILLFVSAVIPGKVFAETTADPFLMVRIEDPESSFNEPFKITFVVMDASGENRNLTAVCSKDGPSSGWEDFQTISDSNFNENGGTNICNVTDAVLEGTGTYKFKVTVTAEEAEGSAVSEEVTTTYDNDGPDKPKYIEVDRKSDCKYEVTLKTADDSQTDYVEVYMSDEKEFTAGPGSRIRTFTMGPDEKKTFTEEVAGEKCAHRQYFAVRAFDSAGNGSDVEAEELTNVNTVTVNKEETVYEASLTSAGASSIGTGTGSEGADVVPSEEEIGEGSGEEGSVLGEQVQEEGTQQKSFFGKLLSSPWTWIALVIILGGLTINGLRKRNE